ncbi:hypothetical protein [Nocardia sp. NBC_00416]|uniref:hypothetical protein n=1 Tax=Nocardia sp. NBC_00416 TaxID=2975991 RepID=UPI002E1EDED1
MRRDWWDITAAEAGLEGSTPHEMRHTAASLAVSQGASVLAVQRMLGHDKPARRWMSTRICSTTTSTRLQRGWTPHAPVLPLRILCVSRAIQSEQQLGNRASDLRVLCALGRNAKHEQPESGWSS